MLQNAYFFDADNNTDNHECNRLTYVLEKAIGLKKLYICPDFPVRIALSM